MHYLLRTSEAAAELGVDVSTVLRWIRHGQLEAIRLRGFWFIPMRAVRQKKRQLDKERHRVETMLSKEVVAAYFWVTTQTVRCWTRAGWLTSVLVSRSQDLYPERPILRLLAEQGYDLNRLSDPRVNTATAAELMGMSDGSVLRFVHNGTLPAAYTLSGHARLLVSDVEKLKQSREGP
jgi:excisionase family DNA binding protein